MSFAYASPRLAVGDSLASRAHANPPGGATVPPGRVLNGAGANVAAGQGGSSSPGRLSTHVREPYNSDRHRARVYLVVLSGGGARDRRTCGTGEDEDSSCELRSADRLDARACP